MDYSISELIIKAVAVDSIGSIVLRGIIWLVLVSIIAIGTAKGKDIAKIKNESGLFLVFIVLTGVIIYLVFGIIPTITGEPQSALPLILTLASLGHELYQRSKTAIDFL